MLWDADQRGPLLHEGGFSPPWHCELRADYFGCGWP